MANCVLCEREFWTGEDNEHVIRLAYDGRFCVECAVAACEREEKHGLTRLERLRMFIDNMRMEYAAGAGRYGGTGVADELQAILDEVL